MAKLKKVTTPSVDKDGEPLKLSPVTGGVQIDTLQKLTALP